MRHIHFFSGKLDIYIHYTRKDGFCTVRRKRPRGIRRRKNLPANEYGSTEHRSGNTWGGFSNSTCIRRCCFDLVKKGLRPFPPVFCSLLHAQSVPIPECQKTMSLRASVVLRAANPNPNDCRWQSYHYLKHWRGNPHLLQGEALRVPLAHKRPAGPCRSTSDKENGSPHQSEDWFAMTCKS